MTVRVRIAPSPTGDPHVGTAYIAIFNLIFARKYKGQFILRIEDTDQARSHPEYERAILEALRWCQIDWDEGPDKGGPYGPYRQSERTTIYAKYARELVDKGFAYKCFATPEELEEMRQMTSKTLGHKVGYDRRYRNLSYEEVLTRETRGEPYVIRLKIPLQGDCVFDDIAKGTIVTPWADIDDQVLLKSDGFPTYHLANVVDDHLMRITHVIRGDEWMSSTPKHLFLYQAFGWTPPRFLHMPLLLGQDGKKLSKRRNPTSIFYFRDLGYLPEALMNFLTLMGYRMPNEKETYTLDELIASFDETRIGVAGAFFDIQKLDWLNQKTIIETLSEEALLEKLKAWQFNDRFIRQLIPLVHTRIKNFSEFIELTDFLFIQHLSYPLEQLVPKTKTPEACALLLQALIWKLDANADWTGPSLESAAKEVATLLQAHYKKEVIPLLFMTLMGKQKGPPLFQSVTLLGKDRMRARFLAAIHTLGGLSSSKITNLKEVFEQSQGSTSSPLEG
jgi:glutamyl-tRNA synthetase